MHHKVNLIKSFSNTCEEKGLIHPSNVVDAKEETGRGCNGFYGPEISNWKARPPTLLQVLPK